MDHCSINVLLFQNSENASVTTGKWLSVSFVSKVINIHHHYEQDDLSLTISRYVMVILMLNGIPKAPGSRDLGTMKYMESHTCY